MQNMNRNMIITGVIALIVGLLFGWLIGRGAPREVARVNSDNMIANIDSSMMDDDFFDDSSMMDDTATDSMMMADADAAVLVTDQAAGNSVQVASVETDTVTWVAVRENMNGVMGNILGAARIEAGASNNVVVDLLRGTMAGKDYFVVLFKDNGDRMFDHKVDMIMTLDNAPIAQSFKTLAQ